MKKLLTIEETAEIIGFKVGSVYKLVCQKRIPYLKVGGALRFDPDELEIWLDKKKIVPVAR